MYRVDWLKEPNALGEHREIRSNAQQKCVNWNQLYEWAEKRALLGDRYFRAPNWQV